MRTACEANAALTPAEEQGRDVGAFEGITVEDYGTELVLTSHAEAGWYRYRMKWHLYADGRIWPEFSFAAVESRLHPVRPPPPRLLAVRLRPGGDARRRRRPRARAARAVQTFATEAARRAAPGTFWSVDRRPDRAPATRSSPATPTSRLPADPFSKTDALVLRYKLDEIDDGLTVQTGCAFAFEPFVDGEALARRRRRVLVPLGRPPHRRGPPTSAT